ncbi:TetR/AcrR family transcriptional regulator [Chelativorans sp. YIM 93263]|uniref:TetR/AcrR family transcriptional regulator n=1 Tax=Chelativorans sp. YIM 93263 TaxID=2906648 RepID=UPI0023797A70|nr:TetR/AcrR family transcriptional regulator [Chelativorans sp. YIM 93263]
MNAERPEGRLSRREQIREATLADIRKAARELLVSKGSTAVTVNAVARKLGVSGPALYRYHASQADLVKDLRKELFGELIEWLRQAGATPAADTPARRLLTITRALRGWAVSHRPEFCWLFASPAPDVTCRDCAAYDRQSGRAFSQVFLEQVAEIWETRRFPIPSLDDKDPSLARQIQVFSEDSIGGRLPPEAAYIFLHCWMRLYGLLCMEALNQISFALTDVEPVFEEYLQDLCSLLDVPYEEPGEILRTSSRNKNAAGNPAA